VRWAALGRAPLIAVPRRVVRCAGCHRKIAANYYPMVAQSYLTDGTAEIVTLSDRTVGVASLAYGEFEAMLHRRCSQDDGRGVGEALNDQNIVYPRLRFFVGSAQNMERIRCASGAGDNGGGPAQRG